MTNSTLLERIGTPVQTPVQTRTEPIILKACPMCQTIKLSDGTYLAKREYDPKELSAKGIVLSHGIALSTDCYINWALTQKTTPTEKDPKGERYMKLFMAQIPNYELKHCPA